MKHNEIHTPVLPYWLQLAGPIILAEGENDDDGGAGSVDEDDSGVDEDIDEGNTDGLKSALQKERQAHRDEAKARKAMEAELLQLRKEREAREAEEKTEIERLQDLNKKLTENLGSLSNGYVKDKVDAAIEKAAEKAKFADPTDAIALVDRAKIEFEQDSANPSEVTIDLASVDRVVKDLATRKPHYLKSGTDDGEPSGSAFGGSRKAKGKADEEGLKDKYPALR